MLFNLLIIYGSFSNHMSGQDNVRIYVGIPTYLAIVSTSLKNCFKCAGVPLAELINENSLSQKSFQSFL